MKIAKLLIAMTALIASVTLAGCGSKPQAANSGEAIQQAKEKGSVEEQAKYLVGEAKAFINNGQYKDAISAAQHVARNYQEFASDAQKIIEQAKAELKKEAEKKMAEVKGKLGSIGQK